MTGELQHVCIILCDCFNVSASRGVCANVFFHTFLPSDYPRTKGVLFRIPRPCCKLSSQVSWKKGAKCLALIAIRRPIFAFHKPEGWRRLARLQAVKSNALVEFFMWSRLHMKLNMDKSYPRKTQGQLPFPFSQTNKLDESVPIAWRIADTLMPSARPRDISSQP